MALRVFDVELEDNTIVHMREFSFRQYRDHTKEGKAFADREASPDEWFDRQLKTIAEHLIEPHMAPDNVTADYVSENYGRKDVDTMYLALLKESGLDISKIKPGEDRATVITPPKSAVA